MEAAVKQEDGGLSVKPDPDRVSPALSADDDAYEDTGELEIPKKQITAQVLRVPDILYDNWNNIAEDEEIELGVVRHYTNTNKYQLILSKEPKCNAKVPKEYNLNLVGRDVHNTFVFSEKDLEDKQKKMGFRAKDKDALGPQGRANKSGRYQPYYRRSIPKQTALTATVKQEYLCSAVENAEYRKLLRQRMEEKTRNKPQMAEINTDPGKLDTIMLANKDGEWRKVDQDREATDWNWKSFVNTGYARRKNKSQQNKATRMSREELLDRIFVSFRKYKYWSMKALRQELQQPEAYLKEVLDGIATLHRAGPLSNHFELNEGYKTKIDGADVKEEIAPEGEDMGDTEGDEDDDDDEDMEDVL